MVRDDMPPYSAVKQFRVWMRRTESPEYLTHSKKEPI
jgi:hypothetical protein